MKPRDGRTCCQINRRHIMTANAAAISADCIAAPTLSTEDCQRGFSGRPIIPVLSRLQLSADSIASLSVDWNYLAKRVADLSRAQATKETDSVFCRCVHKAPKIDPAHPPHRFRLS